MDIERGKEELVTRASAWLDEVDILSIELHERIVAGAADAFDAGDRRRHVIPAA